VRYNLAVLELEIDNPEQAHQVIEPGIETVEEDAEYRWIASEAAFRAGRPERALEHLEVYRALNVDEPEELARLAQRYAEWDYPLPALEILDAIPETVDNDPDLQLLLAEVVLRGTDDFDRGLTALEEAVDGGIDLEGERVQELLAELSREEAELLRERLQALTDPTEETEVEQAELPDAPETPTAEPENGVDDPQSPPEPLE
jgi:predicted Zn-dependent protease